MNKLIRKRLTLIIAEIASIREEMTKPPGDAAVIEEIKEAPSNPGAEFEIEEVKQKDMSQDCNNYILMFSQNQEQEIVETANKNLELDSKPCMNEN